MQTYIGTKIIKARPATRDEVEELLKRSIGGKEEGAGYLVEYPDGYQSWSPKDVFEAAYRPMAGLTFGLAIEAAKKGLKVARQGWNGKGIFVFLVPGSHFTIYPEGTPIDYRSHLDMKTADGSIVPWLASQTDVLAEDWEIVQ